MTAGPAPETVTCPNCRASFTATGDARQATCPYCGASVSLEALAGRRGGAVAASVALAEDARLRKLRGQRGLPIFPPASIAHLFDLEQLRPGRAAEARTEWARALRDLEAGPTEGDELEDGQARLEDGQLRLVVLTLALCDELPASATGDRRALIDRSLPAVGAPRLRARLIAEMVELTAREADFDAAECWLGQLDARSDDLDVDSAYRGALAFVALCRGDAASVLAAIGAGLDDVPIGVHQDLECVMLRAQAHEARGDVDRAVDQLVERSLRTRGAEAIFFERAAHDPLLPLSQTLPRVKERLLMGEAISVRSKGAGSPLSCATSWLLVLAAVTAGIALGIGRLSEGAAALSVLLLLIVGGKLGAGALSRLRWASRRWRGELRRRATAGRARITRVRSLFSLPGAGRVELELLVSLSGRSRYGAVHREMTAGLSPDDWQPGQNVKVLVDTADARRMAVDWT